MRLRKFFAASVAGLITASMLAACGAGRTDTADGSSTGSAAGTAATAGTIKIGTTDKVVALDPAGSYDNGSNMVQTQIYQYLLTAPAGGGEPVPDAAEKCEFTDSGKTFTCTMKEGLKFTNGDDLTAEDAAFSFKRIVDINDENGPSSLLANMESVEAKDAKTVVFTLKTANDQTFPAILTTVAGPIVDSKVFPADKLLEDTKVVGSGPYSIKSYQPNKLLELTPNADYPGTDGKVANGGVVLQYFANSTNLALAVKQGDVDVAWRSLDSQTLEKYRTDSSVKVWEGPGGELRYIVFNLKTMPGDTEDQKLAIRRAVAYSVNRQELSDKIYKGDFAPAYSMVASSLEGATTPFKTEFGEAPDTAKAKAELEKAGVTVPATVNLQYNPDHYGPGSANEYGEVKRQLEASGLFKVNLQSTEWTTYNKERKQDAYPVYQLGWFPDFSDADNYLSPFLVEDNFVGSHYCDSGATNRPCDIDGMNALLQTELTATGDARTQALAAVQEKLATGQLPYLPLLEGKQFAVSTPDVKGVDQTLDSSFKFRFWLLSK
ncbi:peptide ABC transporter substrate-binding protein [Micrococcales bacterium 31B]|nr:peptide ABC transporter substrate-binding protein [Micrococcales bacterium 31B]